MQGPRPDPVRVANRKMAARINTDTATLYAIAPERLYAMLREGQWGMLAEALWGGGGVPMDPTQSLDRLVRLHGGAVFFMGRDGFYDVAAPDAWREYGYLRPRGVLPMNAKSLPKSAAWKPEGDGKSVGLFLPLPAHLAAQFPSLGENDDSPPHVTLLYVGDVPKAREKLFLSTVTTVLSKQAGPIIATLGEPDFFVHPDKDRRVWYSRVTFSKDMAEIRDRLWLALEDAGFDVKHSFSLAFTPHVTLAYMEGEAHSHTRWKGSVPKGSWSISSMSVWGMREPAEVMLGTFQPQSFIEVATPHHRMVSRVATRWVRAEEGKKSKPKLRVFDFDDTLVSSEGSVTIVKPDGERVTMNSATFAHLKQVPGDKADHGAFNNIVNPRIIKKNFDLFRQFVGDGEHVVILTARPKGSASAVKKFLKEHKIEGVKVVALASSDPYDKARWIDKEIEAGGYDDVAFFDDSSANARAVAEHAEAHRAKGLKFESSNTPHPHEDDYDGPASKHVFESDDPTVALVPFKPKPNGDKSEKPTSGGGSSSWWDEQTPTFQEKYCGDHPSSAYCKAGTEVRVASNNARKKAIEDRAGKSKNQKVKDYTSDFLDKIDQIGPAAGAWLEDVESHFDDLVKKPDGLLKGFKDADFDELYKVLFGGARPKGKAARVASAWLHTGGVGEYWHQVDLKQSEAFWKAHPKVGQFINKTDHFDDVWMEIKDLFPPSSTNDYGSLIIYDHRRPRNTEYIFANSVRKVVDDLPRDARIVHTREGQFGGREGRPMSELTRTASRSTK